MSSWKKSTIGDIANVKTGPFGSALLNEQYIKGGTPVITVEHIKDFRICQMDYPSVTDEDKQRLLSYTLEEGDIVFSRVGSVDLSAIALTENNGWLFSSRMLRVRPDRKRIDPLFLSYYLRLYGVRKYINNIAVGSTMPSINTEILKSIPVSFCELKEQKEIAKTLSNLDKKITLLRQQNHTLEELAQTLFKRWFVEFEFPNEHGEPYKSSGGIMVECEFGEVPEGWRDGVIEDFIGNLESGSRPKGGVGTILEGVPSIGAENVKRIGVYDFSKTKYIPEEFFSKMKKGVLKNRDILVYKDGGAPGTFIPHYTMVGEGFPFEEMSINEHVFRVNTNHKRRQNYLFLWLNTRLVKKELAVRGTGAAIPGINSTEFRNTTLVLPKDDIVERFDIIVEPIITKILKNSAEAKTLAKLRDTLLPKLMSGEIRVEERDEL